MLGPRTGVPLLWFKLLSTQGDAPNRVICLIFCIYFWGTGPDLTSSLPFLTLWGSFLQLWLYRNFSANLQLVVSENCPRVDVFFYVCGRTEFHIFLLYHLDLYLIILFLTFLFLNFTYENYKWSLCFPCGSAGKESACNMGDLGWIPGLERSPREGKGYPLQYPGLENSMDCIVHGVAKGRPWLRNVHFHFLYLQIL